MNEYTKQRELAVRKILEGSPCIPLGHRLYYRPKTDDDYWIIPEIVDLDMYRFAYLATIKPCVRSTVLDCGAHIGIFSIMAASFCDDIDIHAFEPHIGNYNLLVKNIAGKDNIFPHPQAVGLADSVTNLFQQGTDSDGFTGRWTLTPPDGGALVSQQVEVVDINRFILSLEQPVFVLKLDMEGFEAVVIETISSKALEKVKILIVEEHHIPVNHQRLQNHGFYLDFNPLGFDRHFVYVNKRSPY